MKKRILSVILVAMAIGMIGCGKKSDAPVSTPDTEAVADTEAAADDVVADDAVPEDTDNNSDDAATSGSLGATLSDEFKSQMANGASVEDAVNAMAALSGFDCATMECEEGFLNGFSEEIHGFNSATMFSPYIGSIPFVAYVFETDDPEALKSTLEASADPRWNICTEAEETVVEVYENYVFFAMLPGPDFDAE